MPKCGGTSIRSSMKKNWINILKTGKISLDHVATATAAQKLGKDILSYREEILPYFLSNTNNDRYILGHFRCTSRTRELFQDQWNFVTFIRDPLKRWYSHYYFDRYREKNLDYKKTDKELEEYLESAEGLQNARLYLRHFTDYVIGDDISEELIDSAVTNILNFDVYGILEKMDWFVQDYESKIGIKLNVPVRNTNPKSNYNKKPFSDENKLRVKELCQYDIQIYDRVKIALENQRKVNS